MKQEARFLTGSTMRHVIGCWNGVWMPCVIALNSSQPSLPRGSLLIMGMLWSMAKRLISRLIA